jgi:heme exporter protein D
MQWHSASEFWAMGGYGLYVWWSIGACALGMLIEPCLLVLRKGQIHTTIRRERLARQQDQTMTADQRRKTAP